MRRTLVLPVLVLLLSTAAAQQSDSYEISDHIFNAGGHPSDGTVLTSASYQVTLDAIGDSVVGSGLSSASYDMGGGFTFCYPPPGEVLELWFTDEQTLVWSPEPSVGSYNLYRDQMSELAGLGYGDCEQQDIPDSTTTDSEEPLAGAGYFYLVTAENRLAEEGTKGARSSGGGRSGTVCP